MGTDKVVVFNWNGSSLSKTADYTVSPGEARGGFSNHPINDEIYITGTSTAHYHEHQRWYFRVNILFIECY